MKNGWQTKTLGEVLQKTETVNPLQSPQAEFDYIDVSSVSNATFQIEATQRLKGKDAPSRARKLVRANDVLFATIRPTLQRIAVVPEHLDKQVCSTGYFVLRPKPGIDHRYVFYFLFTEGFTGQMDSLQKGASYPAVTDGDVKAQLIPILPLPEQQRIVGILDEALEGIATVKATVEKNLQNARTLFESYLQSVFTQRANGWLPRKLGDESLLEIIDGDRGVNYPKAADFHDEGNCLFLNTKNVRPDGFEFESTMFITAEKDAQLRKGKLKRDDVVLTTRGTIGNIGLYSKDVPFDNIRINSGMLIFRPNQRALLPSFLFELLRSEIVKDQIRKKTTGAAQPQLPIKTLVNFAIPVPANLDDQRALVQKLHVFEPESLHLASVYERKLAELEALKKSLLHQAFSGQL
jgi:type I restriction enzyme, S subunit